jgi:hypothetical protein
MSLSKRVRIHRLAVLTQYAKLQNIYNYGQLFLVKFSLGNSVLSIDCVCEGKDFHPTPLSKHPPHYSAEGEGQLNSSESLLVYLLTSLLVSKSYLLIVININSTFRPLYSSLHQEKKQSQNVEFMTIMLIW